MAIVSNSRFSSHLNIRTQNCISVQVFYGSMQVQLAFVRLLLYAEYYASTVRADGVARAC